MRDAGEDDETAVLHAVGDLPQLVRRRGRVVATGHGEHRLRDLAEPVAYVELAQGVAHGGVAGRRRRRCSACSSAGPVAGSRSRKPGREPALGRAGRPARGAGARGPDRSARSQSSGVADLGAGAEQRPRRHPIGRVEQQLQPDGAADGVPGVEERVPPSPRCERRRRGGEHVGGEARPS